jgi:hypothetical protein
LIKKIEPISDNAINIIRIAHDVALDLERAELRKVKRDIEDRLSEIGGKI